MELKYVVCFIVCCFKYARNVEADDRPIDPNMSIVYGPGLNPNIVLPARYFFIQAVDPIGKNLTDSAGDIFKVTITGLSEVCTTWNQVLDLNDGSYIIRYRLYGVCHGLSITIKYNGIQVAQSPYKFNEMIYNEECYCPMDDIYQWQDTVGCPTIYRQIDKDLAPFSSIDMDKALAEATRRFNHAGSYSFCDYAVLDNQVVIVVVTYTETLI